MKKCPFCAEEIQVEAIKCRYCGERLPASEGQSAEGSSSGMDPPGTGVPVPDSRGIAAGEVGEPDDLESAPEAVAPARPGFFQRAALGFLIVMIEIFGLALASAIAPGFGEACAILVGLLALYVFFAPHRRTWMPGRGVTVMIGLVALSILSSQSAEKRRVEGERVAALRQADPEAYLREIASRESPDTLLAEARQLLRAKDPRGYLRVIKPVVSEDAYLDELEELDPEGYRDVLVLRKKEQKELEKKIPNARDMTDEEQRALYARLSVLDPGNQKYAKEVQRIQERIDEKAREAKIAEELQQLHPLIIEQSKNAVLARLKDPDSAKFGVVAIGRGDSGGIPVVCGYVNSRNGFGGYAGEQPFIATGSLLPPVFKGDVPDFASEWNKLCVGKGPKRPASR